MADTMVGGLDGQVKNQVHSIDAFSPPAPGPTTQSATNATALNPAIVANWQ